jgi:hypothetical protein
MNETTRKGIPYKSDEARQSSHIIVRLNESQKNAIKNNALKNNQTVSEYIRGLAIKHTGKK